MAISKSKRRIVISLDEKLLSSIDDICDSAGCTKSDFFTSATVEFIKAIFIKNKKKEN